MTPFGFPDSQILSKSGFKVLVRDFGKLLTFAGLVFADTNLRQSGTGRTGRPVPLFHMLVASRRVSAFRFRHTP